MIKFLSEKFDVIETRYYTGFKDGDQKMKKFLARLRQLGIKTLTKPLKFIKDKKGNLIYKSNSDVEMTVDILLEVNNFEVLILISGDSDFIHLIKVLQKHFQKKIVVYSSRKTIAWELKLTADRYFFF
ncbi:MAG: NYN domain-containing protein [Microgenomates group bacterium]